MIDVVESLRQGDANFLQYCRSDSDIGTVIKIAKNEPDGVEILKRILPKIINQVSGQLLFEYIYDVIELREYTYYLISSGRARVEDLTVEQLIYIMTMTSYGETFIISNLNKVLEKNSYYKIKVIVDMLVSDDAKCKRVFDGFIYQADYDKRICFVTALIKERTDILDNRAFSLDKIIYEKPFEGTQMVIQGAAEEEKPKILPHENMITLLNSLVTYKVSSNHITYLSDKIIENYDKNEVGKVLLKSKNATLYKYLIDNFQRLFDGSTDSKMDMLLQLRSSLDPKVTSQYHMLMALFNMIDIPGYDCHQIFSNILNYNLYDYFKDVIKRFYDKSSSKELKFLNHGVTSYVYRIGDYVIKIGNHRFCEECPKHYRILKNEERRVVTDGDKQPVFYIEVQKYIDRSMKHIDDKMIYELFIDLKESGLELTDPCSLQYDSKNFALLSDYREADFENVNDDNISLTFKETPLVVIDVDLIYEMNNPNKKYFHHKYIPGDYTMECSINAYENSNPYTKKK